MSKQKMGKSRDDIFSLKQAEPTHKLKETEQIEETKDQQRQGRGRPQEHAESWTKATVVLFDTQIHWLDKLALDIRQKTKKPISRAEIIRAMVGAMEESGIDFTGATSESEMKKIILNFIRAVN